MTTTRREFLRASVFVAGGALFVPKIAWIAPSDEGAWEADEHERDLYLRVTFMEPPYGEGLMWIWANDERRVAVDIPTMATSVRVDGAGALRSGEDIRVEFAFTPEEAPVGAVVTLALPGEERTVGVFTITGTIQDQRYDKYWTVP